MKLKPLLLLLLMALPLVSYFTPYAGLPAYAQSSPSGVQHYYALQVTNTQNVATPSPFQQMVNISDTASFWSYINVTSGYVASNVVFYWSNGTVIPSWMENYYPSHSPPYIIWWLKIGSVPASSSITIYMGIGAMTTNFYSTYLGTVGEAPQLSPTYAKYDSGASVFNLLYDNFAGSSLNGNIWNTTNAYGLAYDTFGHGLYINITQTSTATYFISLRAMPNNAIGYTYLSTSSGGTITVGAWFNVEISAGAAGVYGSSVGVYKSPQQSYNYWMPVDTDSITGQWTIQYAFVIEPLPNGVMPSVTIYPISQVSITLNSSNKVNQLSSTNYFILTYINTSTYTVDIASNATYTFNAYQFNISEVSSASTSTERWALPSAVNVIGSAGSYAYTYYTQYSVYANYSVTGTGSGWNAPQLSYTSFGSGAALTLLTSTQTAWADAGTAWSIPTMISSATQEWLLPSTYTSSGTVAQSFSLGPTYLFGNLLPVEQFNGNTEFEYILPTTSQMVSFINNTILNVNSTSSNGYNFQYFPQGTTIYIVSPSGQELLSNTFAGTYQTTLSPPGNSKLYVYIPESSSPFSTQPSIVPTVIGVLSGPIGGIQVFFTLIYAVGLGAIYLRVKSAPFILIVMLITSPIIGTFFVPQMRIIFYVAAALALTGLLYEIVHKSGDM
ncbi:MAG: hypothetical protein JRN61_02045 [Nitrososphaerota archaeon]|nr:hypothetical protein [Nitrososphaerota archaeon]